MPLDSQTRTYLDQLASLNLPPLNELSPQEARVQLAQGTEALGEPEPVLEIADGSLPGLEGDIPIRIYRPNAVRPAPALVFFHGGGWVIGSIATHDGTSRSLANATGAVVVSVEYRLAPEHRFPAAVEDAYSATNWLHENAAGLGIDPARLGVCGDSAGGNLAAVVCLMARDRGGPPLSCQILIYPITDRAFDTSSYEECRDGFMLTRAAMQWFWSHYVPDPSQAAHPYASPLRAVDFAGLPRALVITAEFDPLRDEGEAYARRLEGAGVPVRMICHSGVIHGFVRRINQFDAARRALAQLAEWFQICH